MFSEYLNKKHSQQHPVITNFLITFNPNLAPREEHDIEDTKQKLKLALHKLFSNFENFIDIYEGGKYNKKLVSVNFENIASNVSVVPRVEVGKRKHNVHSHTMMSWSSSNDYFFQINLNKLRKWIREHIIPDFHLEVKWVKNNRSVWEYINKDYN